MKLGQHIDSNNTKVEVEMLTPKQLAKKEKEMQKIREQIEREKEMFAKLFPKEWEQKIIREHIAWLGLGGAASGIPEPHL